MPAGAVGAVDAVLTENQKTTPAVEWDAA